MNLFADLFSNAGFIARAQCGVWTPGLIRLHNVSDFLIWTAYIAIPIVLVKFAYSRRKELPFKQLFWLFGLFILACGTTHLMDIVMFYNPLYRLSGVIKLVTAAASWGTVIALVRVTPLALAMRSPEDLEREIEQRQAAEAGMQSAYDQLEARVAERTAELEKTGADLRASESSFRLLTEVMPQIVWTARPDGFLDHYNQRWTDYTGMTIEETQGWGWQPVLHPDDLEKTTEVWRHATQSGEPYQVEYRFKRASDGVYRWHLGRAMPMRDESGNITKWFGTCTDIDDQKRAQQELQRSHEELENRVAQRTAELARANQSQQRLLVELERSNAELQSFASIASHDLQEPLRKIQAFGDRLKTKCADDLSDDGKIYVDRMQDAARRMGILIYDLLELARVTSKAQPFAPVDLSSTAREVASDLETRLEQSGGKIEIGELPTVEADRLQMRQLLQNLIGNAFKFHKPGEAPLVRVESETRENRVRLTISDNGIGFDEKHSENIFAMFQRLHGRSEYEGTGIGLAIVKKIVERHGGEIFAHSVPGEGATFVIDLPLSHNDHSGHMKS